MADENAIVPQVIDPTMAKLSITYNGQQGDMDQMVPFDATNDAIKQMAAEAVRGGSVRGIDAIEANFTDFEVDRFSAHADVPFNRLSIRPKTPFGC